MPWKLLSVAGSPARPAVNWRREPAAEHSSFLPSAPLLAGAALRRPRPTRHLHQVPLCPVLCTPGLVAAEATATRSHGAGERGAALSPAPGGIALRGASRGTVKDAGTARCQSPRLMCGREEGAGGQHPGVRGRRDVPAVPSQSVPAVPGSPGTCLTAAPPCSGLIRPLRAQKGGVHGELGQGGKEMERGLVSPPTASPSCAPSPSALAPGPAAGGEGSCCLQAAAGKSSWPRGAAARSRAPGWAETGANGWERQILHHGTPGPTGSCCQGQGLPSCLGHSSHCPRGAAQRGAPPAPRAPPEQQRKFSSQQQKLQPVESPDISEERLKQSHVAVAMEAAGRVWGHGQG